MPDLNLTSNPLEIRAVAVGDDGTTIYSDIVTVNACCVITGQPSPVSGPAGSAINLSASASGPAHWEFAPASGGPWTPGTPPTTMPTGYSTWWRYCCDSGGCSTAVLVQETDQSSAITGTITKNGAPVQGVNVNLYLALADGSRDPAGYLANAITNSSGLFTHEVTATDCYVLVYIAPSGETWTTNNQQYLESAQVCVTIPTDSTGWDQTLNTASSDISGTITQSGAPVQGININLYRALPDGSRDTTAYLGNAVTDANGFFSHTVTDNNTCFVLLYDAGQGQTWTINSNRYYESGQVCVTLGTDVTGKDQTMT